jgi:hypothetical protein
MHIREAQPLARYVPRWLPVASARAALDVAKKVARKSPRIAHGLPSDELGSCAPERKYLQMRTICRGT